MPIGDLINTPQLAHVAYAEAVMVVKELLGECPITGGLWPSAVGDLLPSGGCLGWSW
jgi:pyruvate/2-oxoglutarate dehydrogenase complex dihydrolipoamide dehydrogenase (E3) component